MSIGSAMSNALETYVGDGLQSSVHGFVKGAVYGGLIAFSVCLVRQWMRGKLPTSVENLPPPKEVLPTIATGAGVGGAIGLGYGSLPLTAPLLGGGLLLWYMIQKQKENSDHGQDDEARTLSRDHRVCRQF